MSDSIEVPKDRYCSSNVTIEDCSAFYVHLEPLFDMRCDFMFWRGRKPPEDFKHSKPRFRDLRPGDEVIYQGIKRKVASVEIYR